MADFEYIIPTARDLKESGIAAARAENVYATKPITRWGIGTVMSCLLGAAATLARNVGLALSKQFYDLFVGYAEGDRLDRIIQDRYPSLPLRFAATKSVGILTFTRATTAGGVGTIAAGTRFGSVSDTSSTEEATTFALTEAVNFGADTLSAQGTAECEATGKVGNVRAGVITNRLSTIFDNTIAVTNTDQFAGGNPAENDDHYRERAYNAHNDWIRGNLTAIKLGAQSVSGVWHCSTSDDSDGNVYIAISDASGACNQALVDSVRLAVLDYRGPGLNPIITGLVRRHIVISVTLLCETSANLTQCLMQAKRNVELLNETTENQSGVLKPGVDLTLDLLTQALRVSGVLRVDIHQPVSNVKCGFSEWLVVDTLTTDIQAERTTA